MPTSLVLVDAALIEDFERHATTIAEAHAGANFALMQFDGQPALSIGRVFASPLVRGMLPMSTKLDVWLSVIHLLRNGGDYYPLSVWQQLTRDQEPRLRAPAADEVAPGSVTRIALDILTDRERQILEMVAHGQQNKVIAGSLNLSESTVKIHLHNIIRKLKVHNRTEAAALYHRRPT